MLGELVSVSLDYDVDGRSASTCFPAEAVGFAGNGQLISQWGGDVERGRRASDHGRRLCTAWTTSESAHPCLSRRRQTEPFLRKHATRWADTLGAAGNDVVLTERDGSHGDAFWREEFPLMVAWAFGR